MEILRDQPTLVDIGANLSHSAFSHDLELVLAQAREAGVAHIVLTGTDQESVTSALKIARRHPDYLTVTAGFHPHVATRLDAEALAQVRHWLADPLVVAAGEMGLDFNRNFSPRDSQVEAFAAQLELAAEAGKPVFLHQRDAHEAFHSILREYRHRLPAGVVHCFTDAKRALYDYLDLDMHIGITGWICDERRGLHLQELVAEIPATRLLLETDAPYLLPRSLTPAPASRRNEPRYLVEVLNTVARCRQQPPVEVAAASTRAAVRLFGLPLEI